MSKEVLIEILGKKRAEDKKTLALPSRRRDKWGRRRTDSRKYLNIYDLGRFDDGSDNPFFCTNQYNSGAGLSFSTGEDAFDLDGNVELSWDFNYPTALINNLISSWRTDLLSTALEDFPDTFRNITTELADYHLSLTGTDGYVTGRGLLFAEAITNLRGASGFNWDMTATEFFPIWLDNTFHAIKITTGNTYASSSVPLVLDKSVDLFLMPMFYFVYGAAQDDTTATPTIPYLPQTWSFAASNYQMVSRTFALGNASWDAVFANRPSGSLTNADRTFLSNMFFNNGLVSVVTADAELVDYPGGGADFAIPGAKITEALGGFPTNIGNTHIHTKAGIGAFRGSNDQYDPGLLLAVVRKRLTPGTYEDYYIWLNASVLGPGNTILAGNQMI